MNTMFNKKIILDDDMRSEYTSLSIELSEKEQELEGDFDSIKEKHKSKIKKNESDTLDLILKRRKIEKILKQGFEEREIPCKIFTDAETYKLITIELETCEILAIEDIDSHANLELEFNDFNILSCDFEKFKELLEKAPEIFAQKPTILHDINLESYLYAFGTNETMRVIKMASNTIWSQLLDRIEEYNKYNMDLSKNIDGTINPRNN